MLPDPSRGGIPNSVRGRPLEHSAGDRSGSIVQGTGRGNIQKTQLSERTPSASEGEVEEVDYFLSMRA